MLAFHSDSEKEMFEKLKDGTGGPLCHPRPKLCYRAVLRCVLNAEAEILLRSRGSKERGGQRSLRMDQVIEAQFSFRGKVAGA